MLLMSCPGAIANILRRFMGFITIPVQLDYMASDNETPCGDPPAPPAQAISELEHQNRELRDVLEQKEKKLAEVTAKGQDVVRRNCALETRLQSMQKEAVNMTDDLSDHKLRILEQKTQI